MTEEVFIPKLGQTVEEVTIIQWKVVDGSQVEQGQEILEVETDKAVFPIEASANGFIHLGPYYEGDVVSVLATVATIGKKDETFSSAARPAPQEEPDRDLKSIDVPDSINTAVGEAHIFVSPRARRLAHEQAVDLRQVSASGEGGIRIVERDIQQYLKQSPKATPLAARMAAVEGIDTSNISGSGARGKITKADISATLAQNNLTSIPLVPESSISERRPLKGIRNLLAERMAISVHTTARVTLCTEVDAEEFVSMRSRLKSRVETSWGFAPGYNDFFAKIVATALRRFPYMNARLNKNVIELISSINVGIAVDTDRGLMVPVIRDADQKSLYQFGVELRDKAEKARKGNISPDDLSGGTFTLTNLGMYDIDAFTPVINLPEAAILGIGRIVEKVVPRQGQVMIRKMCTLSLVFDHRLIDGAPAGRFLKYIKDLVEEPYLWLTENM